MKKQIVAMVLIVLMLLTTGCSAEDQQVLIDIALSWAAEHAGELASYGIWGTSGNDEVDAVLGARDVVKNINAADQLMEEGRKEGDLSKMEEAIEKRPGDYTYRTSYAAALLQQGDAAEAEAQFAEADAAVGNYSSDHAQTYATQGIDELGALRYGFEKNGFASTAQCHTYYGRMAYFYEIRAATGDDWKTVKRKSRDALIAFIDEKAYLLVDERVTPEDEAAWLRGKIRDIEKGSLIDWRVWHEGRCVGGIHAQRGPWKRRGWKSSGTFSSNRSSWMWARVCSAGGRRLMLSW